MKLPHGLPTPEENLYACIDDFLNTDYVYTLIKSIQKMQTIYTMHNDMEGMDEEEKKESLDVIRDGSRTTTFIIELSEKFAAVQAAHK